MQIVKDQQAKAQARSSNRGVQVVPTVKATTSSGEEGAASLSQSFNADDQVPNHFRSMAGDEGLSENDSAFFSGTTNSKHSLSGGEHGSNFSISSCSTPADANKVNSAAVSADNHSTSCTITTASTCCSSVMDSNTIASSGPAGIDSHSASAFAGDLRDKALTEESPVLAHKQPETCAQGGTNEDAQSLPCLVPASSSVPSSSQSWCDFPGVDVHNKATITVTTSTTSAWSPSSSEQHHVDLSALCSRLSSVGGGDFVRGTLASSHSDPSIYHTLGGNGGEAGNDSDDSMRCIGSSRSHSVCSVPEDTSVEFNLLSPSLAPDPEPMLSSPEDGYAYEDDNLDEAQSLGNERSSAAGSSVDPVSDSLNDTLCLCKSSGQGISQLTSSYLQEDAAVGGCSMNDEEWWDTDVQEQPQPFPSFLARTTSTNDVRTAGSSVATWDMDFSSVGGVQPGDDQSTTPEVEGCDVNLSIKGRYRPVPPPPPPPPPPLPLPANKLNLELIPYYKPGKPSNNQEESAGEESDLDRYFHAVISEGLEEEERSKLFTKIGMLQIFIYTMLADFMCQQENSLIRVGN